ncbi:MAG TPA: restriction endonuclease subunit S [Gaiellaceae bacterium]|nr:restriction endonuclease subunit S [Gaiellaceae bacterium]
MTSRNGWRRIRFGEIAENVTARVDDPSQAGVERYVGLEHLDPGSLSISRWGHPSDVEATKLRFWPGDVIFGRRRAYQRKLAVADFDGICSAHALVLRAKPDVVHPEFLPLFMQSDLFFSRALAISVGSLSPTINWKTLKEQEFDLPPMAEQRNIVAMLSAWEASRRAQSALIDRLGAVKRVMMDAGVEQGVDRELGELLEVCQYGLSLASSDEGDVPILGMTNVTHGGVDLSELSYVTLSPAELERYRLLDRDVLFNRTNSVELVGRTGLYRGHGDVVFASYLIRLRPTPELLPEFLNLFLNSTLGRRRIRARLSKGVSQANISATSIKATRIPLPDISVQEEVVARIEELERAIVSAGAQLTRLLALGRVLRSRELSGVH